MPASLVGIREKVKRADKHIAEIAGLVSSFREASHCEIRYEFNADNYTHRYRLSSVATGSIGPDFAVIVGEAVHQLRSLLDHLVCQLVILEQGDGAGLSGRAWPIYTDPITDKNKAGFNGMIKGVPVSAKTAIEALQPFHADSPDDHPLAMLAKFDNTDKHRNPLVMAAAVAAVRATTAAIHRNELIKAPAIMFVEARCVPLEDDAEIVTQVAPAKMKMDVKPSCEIAFSDVSSAKLEPVIPSLTQLRDAVVKIHMCHMCHTQRYHNNC